MSEATIERDKTGQIAEGLTRALADHASALRFEDIPYDVRTIVKHCVLDWLGVTLAGSREDAGRIVREEALEALGELAVRDGRWARARHVERDRQQGRKLGLP